VAGRGMNPRRGTGGAVTDACSLDDKGMTMNSTLGWAPKGDGESQSQVNPFIHRMVCHIG